MSGPYETEAQAAAEPMPVEIRLGGLTHATARRHLAQACRDAGVELGAYDRQVLEWLIRWEPPVVQVFIGIIGRAGHGRGPWRMGEGTNADPADP